jgi:hypothetical protein
MQQINHWPDVAELRLPEAVSRDLLGQLLEPFDSEKSAKEFWEETRCTVIILEPYQHDASAQKFWRKKVPEGLFFNHTFLWPPSICLS